MRSFCGIVYMEIAGGRLAIVAIATHRMNAEESAVCTFKKTNREEDARFLADRAEAGNVQKE